MGRSMIETELRSAVRDFADRYGHRWSTPESAHGKCHRATTCFVAFARDRGLPARFIRAEHRTWGAGARHTAAEVDGVVIDCTARGNDPAVPGALHRGRGWNPAAPLPLVVPVEEWVRSWGREVEVCPECGSETGHAFLGRCYGIPPVDELLPPGEA